MDNREIVRSHYNQHANPNPNFDRALANRQKGRAAPLKDFHNHIKRLLINRFASNAPMLLDLCCGRGGDVIKWFNSGVRYAKGLDISDGEVVEAARRFEEQRSKPAYSNKPLEAEFEVCTELGAEEWSDGQQYDVVTCMFAMHYFFEREHSLKMFLHNVALNLKPGGIFMGTIPCGKRVLQLLKGKDRFDSSMLKLEKKWQGEPSTLFGFSYTCAISDTVTEGKGDSEGSSEYLSFMRPVKEILASHGIFPIYSFEDSRQLNECFDPKDMEPDNEVMLKHFDPRFPTSEPSLEAASAMFGAFVFQKAGGAPPAVRLPADIEGGAAEEGRGLREGKRRAAGGEEEEGRGPKRHKEAQEGAGESGRGGRGIKRHKEAQEGAAEGGRGLQAGRKRAAGEEEEEGRGPKLHKYE